MDGFCEHCNEPCGSIYRTYRISEYTDQLTSSRKKACSLLLVMWLFNFIGCMSWNGKVIMNYGLRML
jgi:hypothetical protein